MKLSEMFFCAGEKMCDLFNFLPSPYIRKKIMLESIPEKAELTICGLGFYELYVNGERITRGYLSPYISNPDDFLYYDFYNIIEKLQVGENVLGIRLGNGMQNAFGGYVWDFEKASFHSSPKFGLRLELDDVIIEADESFVCAPSPTYFDDLRLGERYDARKEIVGWNLPGFDDSSWTAVTKAKKPKGEKKLNEAKPITERAQLKPVRIFAEGDAFIYDFGINSAGVCKICVTGEPGQKIGMTFGEHLKDGQFHTDNISFIRDEYKDLPPYIQYDEYICAGGENETYTPSFTYHGFRYVKVEGITKAQATPELLTFIVFNTELPERGGFECSDEILNSLQKMTRESTLSNFHHFPTDCPHREKNGWTADAALSSEHTLLNLEPSENYVQWMKNICKSMNDEGAIPGIIPTGGWGFQWGNGPAWDSVIAVIPYFLAIYRDDLRAAEYTSPYLLRYLKYLASRRDEKGLVAFGLGDWCHPTGAAVPPLVLTDSITAVDICTKAAYIFERLSLREEQKSAEKLKDEFRYAIREELLNKGTMKLCGGEQTSQAMGLYYGIFEKDERQRAFDGLLESIEAFGGHMACGVLGARVIFHVLAEFGKTELAVSMISCKDAPSYGNWVVGGETTLAEVFNREGENVASRNHHFFGDISAFFIKRLGGIVINPTGFDADEVLISPFFADNLSFVKAFHITPAGKIITEWVRKDDTTVLEVTIPEGCKAKLSLNDGYYTEISELKCGVNRFVCRKK